MAEIPICPAGLPVKRLRGRPSGPLSAAEVQQRCYRARLKGAEKVVKLADATDLDRALFIKMRDDLHNLLVELELRNQDVARLEARNACLEAELKRLEQQHTNSASRKSSRAVDTSNRIGKAGQWLG